MVSVMAAIVIAILSVLPVNAQSESDVTVSMRYSGRFGDIFNASSGNLIYLYDVDNQKITYFVATTNVYGQVEFNDVPYGTYHIYGVFNQDHNPFKDWNCET